MINIGVWKNHIGEEFVFIEYNEDNIYFAKEKLQSVIEQLQDIQHDSE